MHTSASLSPLSSSVSLLSRASRSPHEPGRFIPPLLDSLASQGVPSSKPWPSSHTNTNALTHSSLLSFTPPSSVSFRAVDVTFFSEPPSNTQSLCFSVFESTMDRCWSWTTTIGTTTSYYYHNHYLSDWTLIIDYEFVWARFFPATLAILPRSKWGPQPSKHILSALWDVCLSLAFTSYGRQGVTLVVCIPLFCQNLVWVIGEAVGGDLIREFSIIICIYVFITSLVSVITHFEFTLPLPFGIGAWEGHQVFPPINFTRLFVWMIISINLPLGDCVCFSCAGNDPNCKGDNTCILALSLIHI